RQVPQLRDVSTDRQDGATTLTIAIDRNEAARFGITPQLIDDTLYDAFGQRQVAQYFTQVNSYHVVLELLPDQQASAQALDSIYVRSPLTGQQVPMAVLTHWTTMPTAGLMVAHQAQFPAVTISFNLAPNVSLGEAVGAIQAAEAQMGAPASLTGSFQG